MDSSNQQKPVLGGIGETTSATRNPLAPRFFTRFTWLLWMACAAAVALYVGGRQMPGVEGIVAVDGLTVVMWSVVTFVSAIVQSYSRRYMAGNRRASGFFARVFGFTVVVMVLVAAENLALFVGMWLAMCLVMADLIGFEREWRQARAASALASRYFLVSTASLTLGFVLLWTETGATTVSGVAAGLGSVSSSAYFAAVFFLVVAAVVQSALFPFHGWLLSSMTAPTPASALMHAGFVNAGGVLLTRFAPLFGESLGVMTAVVVFGAAGAITGKLMKSVRPDIKSKLGCSTTGQMGFMVMQAGLGFFSAAITHLILHAFYKAYLFLFSGERVEHTAPEKDERRSLGVLGGVATAVLAVVGGLVFVFVTGKGAELNSGALLVLLVVVTTGHATREVVVTSVSRGVKFVVAPVVFLTAVAVYGVFFNAVTYLMEAGTAGSAFPVAQPTELTPVHAAVAVAFVVSYVANGYIRRSRRLYVALLNASQPSSETLVTHKEEYDG